jgi:hypothetical protein
VYIYIYIYIKRCAVAILNVVKDRMVQESSDKISFF